MKKILSVILVICLMLAGFPALLVYGTAAELTYTGSKVPVILISGDGEAICDADGNTLLKFRDITKVFSPDYDNGETDVSGAAKNIISTLVEGYKTNDFSKYYDAVYEEISDLFREIQLDKNGKPMNGTNISQRRRDTMEERFRRDAKLDKGYYGLEDYTFWYDWRLDPLTIADELNTHIQRVKEVTGAKKVALVTRCLGTQVALAYVAKYGTDDLHGLCFNGGTMNGAEPLSETICGKFTIDGKAALRLLDDLRYFGILGDFDEFTDKTIDMLVKCGTIDAATQAVKETLYKHIAQGATSAIARATFFGMPCYWGAVTEKDYEAAVNYVFGEEGSEKRVEYAGLIEKLDNYDRQVRQRIPELLKELDDSDCNVCVIAKYGAQMIPTCESMNLVGDQIISAKRASFGATTSTIFDRLSDEYIEKQTKAGLEKYISPDKQIDASTCFWPDNTWFIKGVTHSNWTPFECQLSYTVVTADRQLTVDDFENGQFTAAIPLRDANGNIRFDYAHDIMTCEYVKMTEDNCRLESWADDVDAEKNIFSKALDSFGAFARWFPLFMEKVMTFVNNIMKMVTDIVNNVRE